MIKLKVEEGLQGGGRYTPKLPWTLEETIEIRKTSPKEMARTLRHEIRHAGYARRRDLTFRTVKERRVKEEIANTLRTYLESQNKEELRDALDFYQEQFDLSDKTFSKYVLEVASELGRWK